MEKELFAILDNFILFIVFTIIKISRTETAHFGGSISPYIWCGLK